MSNYPEIINATLSEFGVDAIVDGESVGPSVTRFKVKLGHGVKVERVAAIEKNLALACAAESMRLLLPIPNEDRIGVELPNAVRRPVGLPDTPKSHPLEFFVGEDIEGGLITARLDKMPHLLVAGSTGSGKSVWLNSLLVSLIKSDPEDVQLVLVDPKYVEFAPFKSAPHLRQPVITETDEAVKALAGLVDEMNSRYRAMAEQGVRNASALGLPYIVAVVDELADLILASKDAQEHLVRLAQKARAAGIHLVLATQKPTVDVLSGLLKSNIPSRLAFATASQSDSRVIIDANGAETLLGNGDGLWMPIGARSPIRIQGAYVSDDEIDQAVAEARSKAQVEHMVEQLHPEPTSSGVSVLQFLNNLIREAESAQQRGTRVVEQFMAPKKAWRLSDNARLLNQMPRELAAATDSLGSVIEGLGALRDTCLEQSGVATEVRR